MVRTVGLKRLGRSGVESDRPRFSRGEGAVLSRGRLGREMTGISGLEEVVGRMRGVAEVRGLFSITVTVCTSGERSGLISAAICI